MQKTISKILMSAIVACSLSPAMSQWTTTGTVIAPTVLTNNVSVGTTVNGANIYAEKTNAVTLGIKSQTAGATMFMDKGSANANAAFAYRLLGTTLWNTGMLGGNNYSIRNVANNSFPLVVTQSDNVGIGTLTPGYKLQVIGTGRFEDGIKMGGFGILELDAPGIVGGRLKIDSAGFVGIGTANPFANFVVNSGSNASQNRGIWSGQYSNNGLGAIIGGRKARGSHALPLAVGNGDYGAAFIAQNYDGINYLNSGAIGYRITANPSAGNVSGEWYIASNNSNDVDPYSSNNVRMVVQSSGRVGIGTITPTAKLDVAGDAQINNITVGRGSGNVISNSALGNGALGSNVSGFYNTAVGQAALGAATSNDNTAVGRFTLISTTTGNGNTALGSGANPASATGAESNTTILGFLASTSSGVSNAVQIGNNSVTSVKAANGVVIVSDGRFKKNITANVPGLDFINALSPVTYNYDVKGLDKFEGIDVSPSTNKTVSAASLNQYSQAVEQKEKIRYSGFIAQDVEKAAQKLGYDFSGVYKPQSEKDPYGLSYAEFVVPIVKALQELDAKNKNAELENAELKSKNQSLENRLNEMQQCLENLCNTPTQDRASSFKLPSSNFLAQNQPNPFNQSTAITYSLNSDAANAQIVIRNLNGEQIKAIAVNKTGKGQVTINANELAQGTYTYTLIVNNQSVDTKLMVVTK